MYTPNNVCVYLKAAAGCLSGLGGSGPYGDPVGGDFSGYARMADAYAQEFDTVWGVPLPTGLEEDAIQIASAAVWSTRSPLGSDVAFTPGAYNQIVQGVIARVREGNAQVVSEGIDPNGCIGGSPGPPPFLSGLWIDVPAGTTIGPPELSAMYKADSSGAQVQFLLQAAPADGFTFLIHLVGTTVLHPVTITVGAGDHIEDPQHPGTFTTGIISLATPGIVVAYKYDMATTSWALFILGVTGDESFLTANFTQSAIGATVVAHLTTTAQFSVGAWAYIPGGGYYLVTAVGANAVTLENLSNLLNAAPTTVIAAGSLVTSTGSPLAVSGSVFDVRNYGATPADVGVGVAAALAAAKANCGGTVYIPPLGNDQEWQWQTAADVDMTNQPNDINVIGQATRIRIAMTDTTRPVLRIVNMPGIVEVSGLSFLGKQLVGTDCEQVVDLESCTMVRLTDLQFWGVQAGNFGVVFLIAAAAHMEDCLFIGCNSVPVDTGTIYLQLASVGTFNNVRFTDFDGFCSQGYGKGQAKAHFYATAATALEFINCFTDENAFHNYDFNTGLVGAIRHVKIQGGAANAPSPDNGFDASIRVRGSGVESLTVEDFYFGSGASSNAPSLAAHVGNTGTTTFIRCAFGPNSPSANEPLISAHTVRIEPGNGEVIFENCTGPYVLDNLLASPQTASETFNGLTTLYPCSFTGVKLWLRADMGITLLATKNIGVGGTFAPVVAGHHLDIVINGTAYSIPFTGAENSEGTFITAINAVITGQYGGVAIDNGAGQILLPGRVQGALSTGTVVGTTSADVLVSLGFVAGPFTNPAAVFLWADESGLADATHNCQILAGTPTYELSDAPLGNIAAISFSGAASMQSGIWTAPLPQPFSILFIGRQIAAGTAYAIDDRAAPVCALFGVAAENVIHMNAGTDVAFPADTTVAQIFAAAFNGPSSSPSVSSNAPRANANVGTNGLSGTTIGNSVAGGQAGWVLAEFVILDHVPTLQELQAWNAYASRRTGKALVPNVPVVFTDQTTSIQSARSINQSPVVLGTVGATNFGSDTSGATTGASGAYSTIAGGDRNVASGQYATCAGGFSNQSLGQASHAEGYACFANSDWSHAEGEGTSTHSSAAHAEGTSSAAYGFSSHAEGSNTNTSGSYAHAEGHSTDALADSSHSEGDTTIADGASSHAEGMCSYALRTGQHSLASGGGAGGTLATTVQQTSKMVFRGTTPGSGANETVLLLYGGGAGVDVPTEHFTLTDGKAYLVSVELIVRTATGGIKTRALTLKASVRCDAGAVSVDGTNTLETFGNAFFATSTLTITASGGDLAITFGTGAGVTAACRVAARVQFTETN